MRKITNLVRLNHGFLWYRMGCHLLKIQIQKRNFKEHQISPEVVVRNCLVKKEALIKIKNHSFLMVTRVKSRQTYLIPKFSANNLFQAYSREPREPSQIEWQINSIIKTDQQTNQSLEKLVIHLKVSGLKHRYQEFANKI